VSKLVIVAKFVAHAEHVEHVARELHGLVEPTRAEAGCERYDLHRSVEDARVFLFFEEWSSRPAWEAHLSAPHLTACRASLEGRVADRELLQLAPFGA